MRFGFTPLYLDEADVIHAAEILQEVIRTEAYLDPAYQARSRVT